MWQHILLFFDSPRQFPGRKEVIQRFLFGVTSLVTGGEVFHPLSGGAVGKAVGDNVALTLLLDGVVTDGGGGLQGFLDVAVFE
jgi:hypothetical protein